MECYSLEWHQVQPYLGLFLNIHTYFSTVIVITPVPNCHISLIFAHQYTYGSQSRPLMSKLGIIFCTDKIYLSNDIVRKTNVKFSRYESYTSKFRSYGWEGVTRNENIKKSLHLLILELIRA